LRNNIDAATVNDHHLRRFPLQYAKILGAIVYIVTCAIRVAFIFESNAIACIRTPTPGMDVDLYWQSARLLVQGACTNRPCFELMMCSSTIYPYWLAFWRMVIGPDMVLHRLLNAGLVSLSAVLLFRLIIRLTGRLWPAIGCSLVWATLPSLIYFDSTLYKTSLAILFSLLLLTLVLSESDASRARAYPYIIKGALTGLLLSALYFIQSATFLFSIVIIVYYTVDRRLGPGQKRVLLASLTGCLLVAGLGHCFRQGWSDSSYAWPWPMKGVHFRIGFNDRADGTYVQLPNIDTWPYGHSFQARMAAEVELQRHLTPAESDQFYVRQALNYIAVHPLDSLLLVIRKTLLFFNDYEAKGVEDLYYLKKRCRLLAFAPFGLGIVIIFAALGVVQLLKSRQYQLALLLGGLLGAVLASNLIIFVSWRYRLLNIVPLMLLAAHGIIYIQEKSYGLIHDTEPIAKRLMKFLCAAFLPMIATGFLAYSPVIGAKYKAFYRKADVNDKLSMTAEKLLKDLHRKERQASTDLEAITRKALLLNKLHRHSEAFFLLESICGQSTANPIAVHQYMVYLMWLGKYDQAIAVMQNAKSQHADLVPRIASMFRPIEKQAFKAFIDKEIR
jgi:hypothetical protein